MTVQCLIAVNVFKIRYTENKNETENGGWHSTQILKSERSHRKWFCHPHWEKTWSRQWEHGKGELGFDPSSSTYHLGNQIVTLIGSGLLSVLICILRIKCFPWGH
jgi:hypothetical protein